jgi:hypothetical protein
MKKVSYFLAIAAAVSFTVACTPKKAADTAPVVITTEEVKPADPKKVAEGPYEKLVQMDSVLSYVSIDKPQVNLDEFKKDKDGFITIFNGVDLKGWRGYNKDTVPGKWSIDNKALKISGGGAGESQSKDGGDIIFAHKFKNFELTFEWKVAKGSNSGVFILAQEIKGEPIYISSPEYQILDNVNHADASQGENGNRQSASLYDMKPAVPQNAKPFDQWNVAGITVFKGSVFYKQNGKTVVEYHLWTPQWTELLQKSKFKQGSKDFPLAFGLLNNCGGDNHEGYIGFQDHGDNVWFRNIKVKVMD